MSAVRAIASVFERAGQESVRLVAAPRVNPFAPQQRRERREQGLVRVLDSSVFVRVLSWSGMRALKAWRDSAGAAAFERWNALALDRRVRLSATALGAAVVVHLVLTRFDAPEPTATVRIVWIGIVAVIAAAGMLARGVAAAWARGARGGEGSERQ